MKVATLERKVITIYKKPEVANLIEASKLANTGWSFHETRRKIKKFLGLKRYKQMVSWKKAQRYRVQEDTYKNVYRYAYCNFIANSNYNGIITKHLRKEHNIVEDYEKHSILVDKEEKSKILGENSKEIQCILCEKFYIINNSNINILVDHFAQKHAISMDEVYALWPSYKTFIDSIKENV